VLTVFIDWSETRRRMRILLQRNKKTGLVNRV